MSRYLKEGDEDALNREMKEYRQLDSLTREIFTLQ